MAKFFNKARIKVADQTVKNHFDESLQNLTTQSFYKNKPIYIHECIPGEKIKVDLTSWTRLQPLINPMLASATVTTRAFFVPMRTIWSPWNSFITQTSHSENGNTFYPIAVPYIKNDILYQYFCRTTVSDIVTEGECDFYDTSAQKRKFKPSGRLVYDVLLNLGYSINFTLSDQTQLSLLPLLAFKRVWYDWNTNPAYDTFIGSELYFHKGDNSTMTIDEFANFMSSICDVVYHWDYFTSAFDNPSGPNVSGYALKNISLNTDMSGQKVHIQDSSYSSGLVPVVSNTQTGSNSKGLSQYGLDALKALSDYVKRLQLTGSRVLDRYFSEHGVKLDNAVLNRSSYLGKVENVIEISDVMSTADTSSSSAGISNLGDYAGKGIALTNGSFEYQTDEFGYLLITSYIEPRASLCQTMPRQMLHLNALDFFNADFDSLGYQAISKREAFSDYKGDDYTTYCSDLDYEPSGVFGYTNRYAEYCCPQSDKLTGDFRCASINKQYESWHLFRMISNDNDMNGDVDTIAHSAAFCYPDGDIYNRIFVNRNNSRDHFMTLFTFKVDTWKPKKPLFEGYQFDSDGAEKLIQVNGTNVHD